MNKIQVVDKDLHEIKQETLGDHSGEVEMVGKTSNGDEICGTHVRFRNINDYESYINAFDKDYESEDAIFKGCFYKVNTP